MKYDIVLSVIFYLCSCFYMFFGVYAMASSAKSYINKLFLFLTISLAGWSFSFSISNSAPTAEISAFWRCVSVCGWGVFPSILLHFVIILTNNIKRLLNKRSALIIVYLPAIINIILFAPFGYLAESQSKMVQTDFGWTNVASIDFGGIWLSSYHLLFTTVSIILLIRWWKRIEPRAPLKQPATYFLVTVLFPFIAGIAIDIMPDFSGNNLFHKLEVLYHIIPTIMLFLTVKRSGLILEKRRIAFSHSDSGILQKGDRLHLFHTAAAVFTIGAVGSFFIGYFVAGRDLTRELPLALGLFIIGMFLIFIPFMSKKHAIQNTLFLITSIVCMAFFIFKKIDTGATTVWAVYIIFLLYTVVLNSRIHAFFFLLVALVTQVAISIIHPNVYVVIDKHEYLTRVIIIAVSYFSVQYLTNEYDSKLQGYQGFAKEQQALELISTNFISVNNENDIEKITEMFNISAETLDFEQAYLVDFSTDYEDAMIVNAHARDGSVESLPFRTGMKVKTATLPMAKALIAQKQPVGCIDITDILIDESEEERNFFEKRGINSYYAVPIILENKVIGMLVVEDRKKADLQVRHNQTYFLGMLTNILADTRKKILYEERLYNYAYFDESTKLANRNMLRKNLEQILHDRKESEKFVIFNIELDNLRMINDTFGHNTGEQVVIKSASILEKLMKEGCTLSRIAEGKLIVVMPIAETAEQIEECANKIVGAFSDPVLPKDGIESLFVTPIIGIAMYPDDGIDADTLLKNADLAAYEAKASDNKIVFCSEKIKSRIAENTLITNRLFKAMQNKEFSLEFQPQISCSTEKIVGVEALLRWNYSDKKRIPPDIFIPMLEQTGLIHDVGLYVLEQSLREHNRLISKGFSPLRFSVNLSVIQFQKETFVPDVSKLITESRIDPKYIELEITESLLSKNFSDTIEKLFKLKELGINIAIDDFGKGYSSLHRLELVPFNRIKIDKSIVDDITLERKKVVIVKTIVSLAKALMADITAEGVETKEQLDFMKDIGCDEIQGYYFSRPLPANALEEFLKKNIAES